MLCENAIVYLSRILPNAEFIVLSDSVEETENRLKASTGCTNMIVRPRTDRFFSLTHFPNKMSFIVDRVLFRYRNLIKTLDGCNFIIVLGGDDISEYYGKIRFLDVLLRLYFLKKAGNKIYLLGQTIGPITSWRIPFARRVLLSMDRIYHRGSVSYNHVTNDLNVRGNSFFSADLAFLDLAREDLPSALKKYNLDPQRFVTFVPSGFWASYCDDYKTYFAGLLSVTRFLLEKCKELNLKLVLLPHVARTSDDRSLVRQMMGSFMGTEEIVAITDLLLPYQARNILGSSLFVVSQRMHGAISSLQRGVPAICLSYSVKFSEVVGSYLGLPELVVDIRRATFKEDLNKIMPTVDLVRENMATLKIRIEKAVNKAKKDALIQIENVAKDMFI